jgi:uncharacterized protein YcbX
MLLVHLAIYPLKSARGIPLAESEVTARGLLGDRRWMVVDANGRCVTQRDLPALARLQAIPEGDHGLRLSLDGNSVNVPCPDRAAARQPVTIWSDTLALPEARAGSEWLTRLLGQNLRLFFHPDDVRRPVEDWAKPDDEVSLADGFPILIASTASLHAISRAAGMQVGMERFRPNLVVDGAPAWAEDGWTTLRVGPLMLDLVKPCARCSLTTVDQELGEVTGDEPLATLRRVRMSGDRRVPGVLFGWNAIARGSGVIRVGDAVEVLETGPTWPIRTERGVAPESLPAMS